MSLNPATVLNPVFNALDALISNCGVYLYLLFVWLSLVVLAWVLGGGLQRWPGQARNSATIIPGIIFTTRPPNQSSLPLVITEIDPVQNDDNEIKDEP